MILIPQVQLNVKETIYSDCSLDFTDKTFSNVVYTKPLDLLTARFNIMVQERCGCEINPIKPPPFWQAFRPVANIRSPLA